MAEIDTEEIRKKLVGKARDLVSEQWEWHLRFNEDRKPSEKSKLNLYVREKGSSIELFWSRFRFMRKPDQSKSGVARYYISKGKWDKYPDGRLTRHAQDEEVEVVLQFEERAAQIRKAIRCLSEMRAAKRKLEKTDVWQEMHDE